METKIISNILVRKVKYITTVTYYFLLALEL